MLNCYLLTESALHIGSCISYMLLQHRSYFYTIARYCPNSFVPDRFCLDGILYIYIDGTYVNVIIKSYIYVNQTVVEIFVIYSRTSKFRCTHVNLISYRSKSKIFFSFISKARNNISSLRFTAIVLS